MASTGPAGSGLADVNKGPDILGAIATTTVLAFTIVIMRLYVRIVMIRAMGVDDYIIIAALICSLVSFGVNIPDVALGAGRHAAYIIPSSNIPKGLKLNFVTQPFLLAGTTLVKVSIGFFLLRIAPNKWYRRALLSVNTFLLVITTFFIVTLFVQCRPLTAVWDFTLRPTAKCWDAGLLQRLSYTNTSINIVTDFGFAALPIPMLWNVQINKRTKTALLALMALGVFAAIAGIMKLTTISSYGRSGDFLFDSAGLTIWTTTELNVGIIAGSIPCLKPLFKFMLDKSGYASKSKSKPKPNTRTYAMQSSGKTTRSGLDSVVERGEYVKGGIGGVKMQTFKSENGAKTRVAFPDDVSEENLLPFEGPGIVKTMQVSVSSDDDRKSGISDAAPRTEASTRPWERFDIVEVPAKIR
ncbi:hypothetical protein B0J14DRAFT_489146 [Halenospora varia]|nr:hypothetical protein B0J14DRAFT_489146 [Halenospora varia]